MLRRLLVLDLGLTAILLFGALKFRQDWRAFGPAHDVAAIQAAPQNFSPIAVAAAANVDPQTDWTEIPTKDPFSFDRNDIDIIIAAEVQSKPVGPKPVLFGVMGIGNDKWAFVASAGGQNTRQMKKGETIDGWTIAEIAKTTIDVEANGTRQTVILNDPTAGIPRAPGGATTVAPPTRSSIIGGNQPPAPTIVGTPGTTTQAPTTQVPQTERCYEDTPFGVKRLVPCRPKQ